MALNRVMDTENGIFIQRLVFSYEFINNELIKFLGKWMKIENITLSEVTQSQKNTYSMYSLISRY